MKKSPSKCKALIVDDDVRIQKSLKSLFTVGGCDVAVASSVKEACDLLDANSFFDVVTVGHDEAGIVINE